jgi:hypothetical protein
MLKNALALLISIAASDVSGTWSATAETRFPSGRVDTHALTFVFSEDGTKLTGSVGPDAKHQFPIEGGRIKNDSLSFDCKWGNGALLHFHLVSKDSVIQGTAEGDAAQVPKDPGPDYTNTIYLTLKKVTNTSPAPDALGTQFSQAARSLAWARVSAALFVPSSVSSAVLAPPSTEQTPTYIP